MSRTDGASSRHFLRALLADTILEMVFWPDQSKYQSYKPLFMYLGHNRPLQDHKDLFKDQPHLYPSLLYHQPPFAHLLPLLFVLPHLLPLSPWGSVEVPPVPVPLLHQQGKKNAKGAFTYDVRFFGRSHCKITGFSFVFSFLWLLKQSSTFFREITMFIFILLSFNIFFPSTIRKPQFSPRSRANPDEVSMDSNSVSKTPDISLNTLPRKLAP